MILAKAEWKELEAAHLDRARALTADHAERRRRGQKHPIFDFLFEYYPVRMAHLQRWHPGIQVGLEDAADYASRRSYREIEGITWVDVSSFMTKRASTVDYIQDLLLRTLSNPAHFDCFGLHEWAMVYRENQPRHSLPLRLGAEGTNKVVESHDLRCTHFDAYRFFTPPARPLNIQVLDRESQPACEQRGCLHATMDLYKWCTKLIPLIPGDLWLDTFELARDCRILDMQASPYDCRDYGYDPVAIETKSGKVEYVQRQRQLAKRGNALRERVLSIIDNAKASTLDTNVSQ